MEKFSQIKYERPDLERQADLLREKIEEIRGAKDYPAFRKAVLDTDALSVHTSTMYTVAHVRNTIDMN
ncbi:MAG: hypothetical protein K5911_03510, partial [Eubacteriales bacterium]|nr:hypothetical protein [Eubacteriales bacterium]